MTICAPTTTLQTIYYGLPDHRERFAEAAWPLVELCADQLLRKTPHFAWLRDDLIGAGGLVLAEIIDNPPDARDIRAYLKKSILRAMAELVAEEENQACSPRTQREARADGRELQQVVPVALGDAAEMLVDQRAGSDFEMRDELLNGCCNDSTDRSICESLFDGFTDAATAEKVALSESAVRERRHAIGERFLLRNPEHRQRR